MTYTDISLGYTIYNVINSNLRCVGLYILKKNKLVSFKFTINNFCNVHALTIFKLLERMKKLKCIISILLYLLINNSFSKKYKELNV